MAKVKIKLGTRDTSETVIEALSIPTWEEYPTLIKDRLRTDGKIYIELDKENFNILAQYYSVLVQGDVNCGLASKASTYYELFGVKSEQGMMQKSHFKSLYLSFDDFLDENIPNHYTYVVCVN